MPKTKRVETLVKSLISSLNPDELLETLDPCSRLKITIKIDRGQVGVTTESEYKITKMKHSDLVKSEVMSERLWGKIFSLKAFSTNPERTGDKKLRQVILQIKRKGYVPHKDGVKYQSTINDIFKGSSIEVRMTSFYRGVEGLPDFRICEIR